MEIDTIVPGQPVALEPTSDHPGDSVVVKRTKKKTVYANKQPPPVFVAEQQAKMPTKARQVSRSELTVHEPHQDKKTRFVSAYDLQVPPDVDECLWLRERGLKKVRRFIVEMSGYTELKPIETWGVDEGEAIRVFHSFYGIERPEQYRYRAVEAPPAKQTQQQVPAKKG